MCTFKGYTYVDEEEEEGEEENGEGPSWRGGERALVMAEECWPSDCADSYSHSHHQVQC